jgi:hypothetical protein
MSRNQYGPEARDNAPAGPGKLSVADGFLPTPGRIDGQAAKPEPAVIAIVVHPAAEKPGFFEARLAGGEPVITASRTPFFDAARRLLDLGVDGAAVLVMRNADSNTECLRATIAVAAVLTVEEAAHGPGFRRHRTGSSTAVEAPSMRSGSRAGTQDPSRTVGGATAPVGTDSASLLAVRRLDSPTEATTELAGANIVEGGATAVGTDIASLLVVRRLDSPTEATTELAGANIVEGGATAVGTDIASLLVVRRLDSPTEATTELAGDDIVEESVRISRRDDLSGATP